jgi:hypothetical protein
VLISTDFKLPFGSKGKRLPEEAAVQLISDIEHIGGIIWQRLGRCAAGSLIGLVVNSHENSARYAYLFA